MYEIVIDKLDERPLYRQLTEALEKKIKSSESIPGDRLPSESKMADETGLSVGTVKKSYACLQEMGLIEKVRGGGAYIRRSSELYGEGQSPLDVVKTMFQKIPQGYKPMNQMVKMAQEELVKSFSKKEKICAALVECNEEILHSLIPALENIPNLTVEPYLLDELLSGTKIISSRCELAFVSQNHYREIIGYMDALRLPAEAFVLVESRETIAQMATIPEDQPVCIIYRSEMFLKNVKKTLSYLKKKNRQICIKENECDDTAKNYWHQGIPFIIPPDYLEYSNVQILQIIARARKAKSRIIPVRYEIDQGSWMHMQKVTIEMGEQKGIYKE